MKFLAFILHSNALPQDMEAISKSGDEVSSTQLGLSFYYPATVAKVPASLPPGAGELTSLEIALSVLSKEIGARDSEVILDRNYTDSNGIEYFYFTRTIQNTPVANQNAAVFIQDSKLLYFWSSFDLTKILAKRQANIEAKIKLSPEDAILLAENTLDTPRISDDTVTEYIQLPRGYLSYCYTFQLRSSDYSKWYKVSVDSQTGQLIQVADYISRHSYRVLARPKNDPRDGFETVNDPQTTASPMGWHSDGFKTWNDTRGNNVDVVIGAGSFRALKVQDYFDTNWSPTEEPRSANNLQAASVQLFYLINYLHDVLYQYGFTESAGNFQHNNFGKGGLDNDRILVFAQDENGKNNANFATPPDGQSGVMKMYLWEYTSPKRDGALDSVIPIHEFMHGVSNRLTGGPSNSNCLQARESAGLGEGWSDAIAAYLNMNSTDTISKSVIIGAYVTDASQDTGRGIRRYPYSTNMNLNPLVFSQLQIDTSVHKIGEVWAVILYEMYWVLVAKLGFGDDWHDSNQLKGNVVALKVIIGGMSLQPCNPSFTQARDAILLAENNFYSGAYSCDIWTAFAKRGLGVSSSQVGYKNGYDIPSHCQSKFFHELNPE
jgi:extracellular elastinolytic metalloproteinase